MTRREGELAGAWPDTPDRPRRVTGAARRTRPRSPRAAGTRRAPRARRAHPPRSGGPWRLRGSRGKRRTGTFVAGAVGVLVVIASALRHRARQRQGGRAGKSPSPTASAPANLPAGVECSGDSCDGKDAESMGCSGDLVTTTQTATIGTTLVEVRYSKVCGAAWGRITQAAQGDKVEITGGRTKQSAGITEVGDTVTYTPMTAVARRRTPGPAWCWPPARKGARRRRRRGSR
ncbi:hypothetical protein SHIRM173S_07766 [Streptomyces hirsutus]